MVLAVSERTFEKEVLNSTVPVLVNFWAPWCGLCRIIDPLLAQVQTEVAEPVKLVRINADENLRLAKSYRLTTLPTVLLLYRGQLIQRMETFHHKQDIRLTLKQALENMLVPSSVR